MDLNTKILQELLTWTRVGFYSSVKQMLGDVLNTDNKRLAYQLADGKMSKEAIRSEAAIGTDSLTDLYQTCVNLGLMEVTQDNKRIRLFDLTNFGLDPNLEAIKKKGASGGGNK